MLQITLLAMPIAPNPASRQYFGALTALPDEVRSPTTVQPDLVETAENTSQATVTLPYIR